MKTILSKLFKLLIVIYLGLLVNGENTGSYLHLLSGRHMVIGTMPDSPYVRFQMDGGKPINVDGFIPKIIEWLAVKYHFTYEYVQPGDKAYGAKINGNWNGLVGMIVRNDVDMVVANIGMTYERYSVVDFTAAFAHDRMIFLLPYPRLANTISSIIRPFSYSVWTGIVLCLLLATVSLNFIEKTADRIGNRTHLIAGSTADQFWFLFRGLVNGEDVYKYILATRLLVAGWCLAAFVLVQSYTSCLISNLTTPRFIPFASTIEDIANSHELTLVVWKYTTMEPAIMQPTSGPLAKLGDQLRAHPENRLDNYKEIAEIVAVRQCAAPYGELGVNTLIDTDLKKTNKCRITTAKEYLFESRIGFVMPKSTPYITAIFSNDLILLQQTGLITRWKNSYLPKPSYCVSQLSSLQLSSSKTKLTLKSLSGAFILYGVGLVSSISIFLLEFYFFYFRYVRYRNK